MHLRWKCSSDSTKPHLSKTEINSCTYLVGAVKYHISPKEEKIVVFFFYFPLRKLFLRAKSFCILPVRKGSTAFGTGLCLLLEEPVMPFSWRKFKVGIKCGFEAIFHHYLWAALQDYVKWRAATDFFGNIWVLEGVREVLLLSGKKAEKRWWAGGGHVNWLTPRHSRAGENHSWSVLSSQQPVIMNWLTARYWWISLEQENKNVEIFFIVNWYWTLRDSPPIYNPVWSSRKPVLEVSHERELCFYLTKALWIFSHFLFDLSVNFLHPLPLLPFWSS